ncbi:hypothetical protein BY996DRAFT_6889149 [Phakopsora pachyrhizi]|nr:hypothetical protein BY996DRAFT_6889149 [Phakopsora pachyrhizi]
MPIVHTEINHFNPPNHIVPNYQHMNGQTGNFWTQPPLQDQSIEGSNLPRPYISSPGREENLINGIVENNHLIKPSNVPNVFGNDIASNILSPRFNSLHDTESNWIQDFENNNHGGSVYHEKSTLGLSGATFFHGNHMNHPNYGPGGFGEKNIYDHLSPENDINDEIFLNDLIHSPPHLAQGNEKGELGIAKGHESAPLGVVTQSTHIKNHGFEIGKTLESDSHSDSSVSNDPWSVIQQFKDIIPNVKLYKNNLSFKSDFDSLSSNDPWPRGEKYSNEDKSLSSQDDSEDDNNIFMEERRPRKKRKISELLSWGNESIKDSTQKSELFKEYIGEKIGRGSSDLSNKMSVIAANEILNPSENKKLKDKIGLTSQKNSEVKTSIINKEKRQRRNKKKLAEKIVEDGEKKSGSTKRKEATLSYKGANSGPAPASASGRYNIVKKHRIIKAKKRFLDELNYWENNIFKKATRKGDKKGFLPRNFSTAGKDKSPILIKTYDPENTSFNSEKVEDKNNSKKQLQDLMMQDNYMFDLFFFKQIIDKVKKINDILLKSAVLDFFVPMRKVLDKKQTGVFYISPEDVSTFSCTYSYLKELLNEEDSDQVESKVFKLPRDIIDWIGNLSIHNIRKRFLVMSSAILKAIGESKEEIINQFKKKQERAIEVIDDIFLNVDFRSKRSRGIKINIDRESNLKVNEAKNQASTDLLIETTEYQADKETGKLIKSFSDYFEKDNFRECSRNSIVAELIVHWLTVTDHPILDTITIEGKDNHEYKFLSFWKNFFSVIRMLDLMKDN